MSDGKLSRRKFLAGSGGLIGSAWVAANFPLVASAVEHAATVANGESDVSFVFLSAKSAALVEAISARIIPGNADDPGAREAHVNVFVDRVFAGVFDGQGDGFVALLNQFSDKFAGDSGRSFVEASEAEQDAFIVSQTSSAFFGWIQFLTHIGMFALPSYGGNFEKSGWKAMGFEDRHTFSPPFGYYDRDYPGFEAVAARYRKEG